MIHYLKCVQPFFEASEKGDKLFEVRNNDRDFKVGDFLVNREWNVDSGYSGKIASFIITYVLADPAYCLKGMVILSLKETGIQFYPEEGCQANERP